jgi:hypothetical protein
MRPYPCPWFHKLCVAVSTLCWVVGRAGGAPVGGIGSMPSFVGNRRGGKGLIMMRCNITQEWPVLSCAMLKVTYAPSKLPRLRLYRSVYSPG